MKSTTRDRLLFTAVFLIFFGFYFGLLIISNYSLQAVSRSFTIPIRILIGLCLFWLVAFAKHVRIRPPWLWAFLIFSLFYCSRIISDYLVGNYYYRSITELFYYFGSFVLLPFLALSRLRIDSNSITAIRRSIFISAFLFSLLALISYQEFIGVVDRMTRSQVGEEEALNPLVLSYCSSLAVGLAISHVVVSRLTLMKWLFYLTLILISLIPFFLGASRGSLFALFIPVMLILLARNNFASNIKLLVGAVVGTVVLVYMDDILGSGLIERFTETAELDTNSGRVYIWRQSFDQFVNNPLFGDKFAVTGWHNYPHNLFLDVLQVTGLAGFAPFLILIVSAFRRVFFIFKYCPKESWIGVLFVQSFTQNMFSGALYTASWFWASMAILFSTYFFLRNENNYEKLNRNGQVSV